MSDYRDNKSIEGRSRMSDLTRAEVIELLDGDWDFWEEFVSPKGIEALKYAISSLKTDETYQIEYENRDFIEILEGATNGEVIEKVFPQLKGKIFSNNGFSYDIEDDDGQVMVKCDGEWWNSPYGKSRNEK